MSRTFKRPYFTRAKQVSKQCRCHGGCPWCLGNRMHKHIKQYAKVRDQLKEKGL